jgi:hypothetical protein
MFAIKEMPYGQFIELTYNIIMLLALRAEI